MGWPGGEGGCSKPGHLCHHTQAGLQAQRHYTLAEVGFFWWWWWGVCVFGGGVVGGGSGRGHAHQGEAGGRVVCVGLGLKEAAANLSICAITIERACRRNGITRWPRWAGRGCFLWHIYSRGQMQQGALSDHTTSCALIPAHATWLPVHTGRAVLVDDCVRRSDNYRPPCVRSHPCCMSLGWVVPCSRRV
jgi:hypothetical protein